MKKFDLKTSILAAGFGCLAPAQGDPLQIDFSTGGGTQAGWEAINGTGSPSGTFSGYTDLATGDITVSLSNIEFNRLYRNGFTGATEDFPETDLDAMYSDLLFRNDDAETVDVTIAGLQAGTYQITSYHLNAPNTPSVFDYKVQDADSPSFGQFVGNFPMGLGNATSFDPTVVNFEVESNGSDDIILQLDATFIGTGGNTGGWFGFNGLVIAVPDIPSTPLQLAITPNSDNPGNYDFSWNSQSGKVYDLVSSIDLNSAPATWEVWNGNADIEAALDTNTLTNVAVNGDSKRFFSIVEKDAAPAS